MAWLWPVVFVRSRCAAVTGGPRPPPGCYCMDAPAMHLEHNAAWLMGRDRGGTVPETGLRSHRHRQHHGPGTPGQSERDETPVPVRSSALEARFQGVRQRTDLHVKLGGIDLEQHERGIHAVSGRTGTYHRSRQAARSAAAPRAEPGNTPPVRDQPAGPRIGCLRRVPVAEFAGSCRLLIAGAFVTMACGRCTNGFTNCCGEICVTVARPARAAPRRRNAR